MRLQVLPSPQAPKLSSNCDEEKEKNFQRHTHSAATLGALPSFLIAPLNVYICRF